MFCGIVENVLQIKSIEKSDNGMRFQIPMIDYLKDIKIGDSISIDGACHSVEFFDSNSITFFSSHETLLRTIVSNYIVGSFINIETSMRYNGMIHGHIVSGHVDCVSYVEKVLKYGEACDLYIKIPNNFIKLCVYKGSICINGVSLTINEIVNDIARLSIVPLTLSKTNLLYLEKDSKINIEFDVIGKYILGYVGEN